MVRTQGLLKAGALEACELARTLNGADDALVRIEACGIDGSD